MMMVMIMMMIVTDDGFDKKKNKINSLMRIRSRGDEAALLPLPLRRFGDDHNTQVPEGAEGWRHFLQQKKNTG